jgi:hypothetical protein
MMIYRDEGLDTELGCYSSFCLGEGHYMDFCQTHLFVAIFVHFCLDEVGGKFFRKLGNPEPRKKFTSDFCLYGQCLKVWLLIFSVF